MRNTLVTAVLLLSLATAAMASDEKKDVQPQSQPTEQTQVARYDADGSTDYASSAKSNRMPKPGKRSKVKNLHKDSEGDPQASQNQVEYGGAG